MQVRIRIDKERCKGCALCVASCIREIIEIGKGLNSKGTEYARITDEAACEGCRRCSTMCPEGAIEIDRVEEAVANPSVKGQNVA